MSHDCSPYYSWNIFMLSLKLMPPLAVGLADTADVNIAAAEMAAAGVRHCEVEGERVVVA